MCLALKPVLVVGGFSPLFVDITVQGCRSACVRKKHLTRKALLGKKERKPKSYTHLWAPSQSAAAQFQLWLCLFYTQTWWWDKKKNEGPLIKMTNAPLPSGGFATMLHAKDVLWLKGRNLEGAGSWRRRKAKKSIFKWWNNQSNTIILARKICKTLWERRLDSN